MLSEGTVKVTVHSARHLADVERGGRRRNDPYVKLSLTHENEDSYQKTTTKEDAGSQASWDETFEFSYGGEPNLFVEIFDKEAGVDELIGFAAIPLAQAPVNGIFDLYTIKQEPAGAIHLSINTDESDDPQEAKSFVQDEHFRRMEKHHHKEVAEDVGKGALAAGLAIGAGLFGKKLFDQHKAKQAEEQ
ncbi:hypothetical protein RO3G_05663 [Lichtheimia corymbifera JMRC:FSU:9682]|uniref:C2 domain-containing protein n=1 Tax=Lichtheimia corymbifera JMRC:FSU:9682 TaxID=1263082 RepID=A0A068RWF4_9FUNG|nr:hypothetical protein RO3G_05663 [Lichtheimia corymbifera JMRC:FSU:9682]